MGKNQPSGADGAGWEDLEASAGDVLAGNRSGSITKPSPDLYPHQWNWDSCFIAIGLSRYDPGRAQEELLSLTRGQWRNGMVPQIVFTPGVSGYFPGPDVWQSERSAEAPSEVQTSGITQPPVLATAALLAYERDPDRERATLFLTEVLPRILAFHRFLYRERDIDGAGLVVVVHPWESGLDNSPPYLDAGSRVRLTYKPRYQRLDTQHVSAANRPTDKDYDLFVWLLEQMREVGYEWSGYLPTATLLVEDVLFNAILCRANADLCELCRYAGVSSNEANEWLASTSSAMDSKLWREDAGLYFSYDRVADRPLAEPTVASLTPLYGPTIEPARLDRLVSKLLDPTLFWPGPGYACPSTSLSSPRFNPANYWLGPVWINTNWLLIRGLERLGRLEPAKRLRSDALNLLKTGGFREYFNPHDGTGYGTNRFSWSAALAIDLLQDPAT